MGMYLKPKDVALRSVVRKNDWARNDNEEDLLFVPWQYMPFADGRADGRRGRISDVRTKRERNGMKKLMIVVACAALAGAGSATDLEQKMKPVRSFTTALGAQGEIVCDAPGDWSFDVLGREVPVAVPPAGLSRVEVPASGHLEIVWHGLA